MPQKREKLHPLPLDPSPTTFFPSVSLTMLQSTSSNPTNTRIERRCAGPTPVP